MRSHILLHETQSLPAPSLETPPLDLTSTYPDLSDAADINVL